MLAGAAAAQAEEKTSSIKTKESKPNIIIILADDISARELPLYESTVWTAPAALWPSKWQVGTSDTTYRANTPVLDRLATQGCYIKTAWAGTICSPSRAMLMTGRYAHLHKWWFNGDFGKYTDKAGNRKTWPLYESSPNTIGHVARQGGYATFWAGKTQMNDSTLSEFGFDAVMTSPGNDLGRPDQNPHTDFRLLKKAGGAKNEYISEDTGEATTGTWQEQSFFWQPSVGTWNWPLDSNTYEWWPNTLKDTAEYGRNTYGPDVELDFIFKFMEQAASKNKPFFIYHTSHLGHLARNWLNQPGEVKFPGTPKIKWDGKKYIRTEPNITGDEGAYDTQGTVTEPGMHSHINYLDYQVWQYQEKLRELGAQDNTIFIFTADNGSWPYGKGTVNRQRGVHVPMIIYAPGGTKHGIQDILVNMSDLLPTVADIAGISLPKDYEINGESLWPYLTTGKQTHRDWIYSYQGSSQIIRGYKVLRDGNGQWWDVSKEPADLDSYPEITDWGNVSEAHRSEREMLLNILPRFDKHASEHDAPINVKSAND